MKKYVPTIGLEIHAELKTRTKMFCDSKNDPDETRPNVNICPVCLAHPGTLPVINKEAVRQVLRVGVAIGGTVADFTEFDRKNYFYPDIPKGYQISQYKHPLVTGGSLNDVAITRVHLEEDTATSLHEEGNYSLVDYNRAGVPLMELVTEPVIHDAKAAGNFARELQLLLRSLGASDANMEKGEMRAETNISVSSTERLGTKVEVKNLNSFRSVERAIEYEIARQSELLQRGESVVQETRGWDEEKQMTYSQRRKEESEDYRYFPDPDLPKLLLSEIPEFSAAALRASLPELPGEARERFRSEFGEETSEEAIEIFVRSVPLGKYLSAVSALLGGDKELKKLAVNYLVSDLLGLMKKTIGDSWEKSFQPVAAKIPPENFTKLIRLIGRGAISSRGAKDILAEMYQNGDDPEFIAKEKNLIQKSNEQELLPVVKEILAAEAEVVSDYKKGKQSALQFLIGQGMKATKGSANPEVLKKLILSLLG